MKHLTRKEIAAMIEMSTRFVTRHERKLGLHAARVACMRRPALWHASKVLAILRAGGWNV